MSDLNKNLTGKLTELLNIVTKAIKKSQLDLEFAQSNTEKYNLSNNLSSQIKQYLKITDVLLRIGEHKNNVTYKDNVDKLASSLGKKQKTNTEAKKVDAIIKCNREELLKMLDEIDENE